MDNRRLLMAFLVSMGILLLWYSIFPPTPTERPQAPAPAETTAPRETPSEEAAETPSREEPSAAATEAPPEAAPEPVSATVEETVQLEAQGKKAVFTNRGAQLVSMTVPEPGKPGVGLDLVRRRQGEPLPFGLVKPDTLAHPLNRELFQVARGADGLSVVFRYSGPAGVAEKRFAWNAQGFLEAEVTVSRAGRWAILVGPGLRNPTKEELESRFERRSAVYLAGDKRKEQPPGKLAAPVVLGSGGLRWVGLVDTYFLVAVVPREGVDHAALLPVLVEEGDAGARFTPVPPKDEMTAEQKEMPREVAVALSARGDRLAVASYWGDKRLETLKRLPYSLDRAVDLGIFGFLVRPLLLGLLWIYEHVVANYGWAIILMTLLIKILLLPLTHHSTMSMRKMQDLNPKMQAIRERYRPKLRDKQGRPNMEMQRKMNEEIMGLYRAEGVNPAGGCLPLLLQMPILFAFYSLLSTAVELRGAPWLLWITDLSVKDPYYVLPIVMGVTQFLQVRMAPPAGDPMQRRIFMLMPVFMTFLFLGFPSGLVLYWLTNNVLTIAQQGVYNHLRTRGAK